MVRPRAAFEDTRLTEAEKASSVLLLAMYSRTRPRWGPTSSVPPSSRRRPGRAAAVEPGADQVDRPERYPAVSRAVGAGVFDAPGGEEDIDDEFDFGLQRVLDGIEALDDRGVRGTRRQNPPPIHPATRAADAWIWPSWLRSDARRDPVSADQDARRAGRVIP